MIVLLALATGCTKKTTEVATTPPPPVEQKAGAPVTVHVNPGADTSSISLVFGQDGQDIEVQVWGTDGVEIPGNKLRWKGAVTKQKKVSLRLSHTGQGNLAVRVVGTFGGERIDEVKSWTIGEAGATPTPKEQGSKGWDATRR